MSNKVDRIKQATAEHDQRGTRKAKANLDKRIPLGIKLDGNNSYVTLDLDQLPDADTPDAWQTILETNPYVSPETHEVDPFRGAEITSWDNGAGDYIDGQWIPRTLHRCKVPVRLKAPGQRLTAQKILELSKVIRKRRPVHEPQAGDGWLVVALADWQLGTGDYGGTPKITERLLATFDTIVSQYKHGNYDGVALVDMGDIVENVACFYDGQSHTVDLNLTDQVDLAIELVVNLIDRLVTVGANIIFGAVPSNHGEFRTSKGTVTTDKARDNLDLVIANAVSRILAANPDRYHSVEVWTPPLTGGDPFVLTLDLGGVMVGFMHGHQVRAMGKGRIAGLEQWWLSNQWTDRQRPDGEVLPTAADCDVMVCGHGHTFIASQQTGKLFVQCPAAASGSEWFTTSTGNRSTAGTLLFDVGCGVPMQANNFHIA